MERTRVLVISHQSIFLQGIQHLLSRAEDMKITVAAEINDEFLATIDNLPPDIAIIDIDGLFDDGFILADRIKQRSPNTGVIILTSNPNEGQLLQALKVQAAAYLGKDITTPKLFDAIRAVARGEYPVDESVSSRPEVVKQLLHEFHNLYWQKEVEAYVSPLTPRETQILNYIAQGYMNKQIAGQLGISEQTTKNHVTSILRKLNANARTQAVIVGIKQRLVSVQVSSLPSRTRSLSPTLLNV